MRSVHPHQLHGRFDEWIVSMHPGDVVNASGIDLTYVGLSDGKPEFKFYSEIHKKELSWYPKLTEMNYLHGKFMFAQLLKIESDGIVKVQILKIPIRPEARDWSICSRENVYCGCSDFERIEGKSYPEAERPPLPLDVR